MSHADSTCFSMFEMNMSSIGSSDFGETENFTDFSFQEFDEDRDIHSINLR